MKYEITSPDGRKYEVTAPDGASEAEVLAYAQSQFQRAKAAPINPTDDMSMGRKILAGVGKGFVDVGRAAGQMVGAVSDQDIAEARKYDAPLMDTKAGIAGNVLGSVAAGAVPAMMLPSVAGAAAVGAGLGALQPTLGDESRFTNTAMGAALGGGAQFGLGKLAGAMGNVLAAKEAEGVAKAAQNSVRDETLRASQEVGYKIPPSQSDGSLTGRTLEGISGKYKTNQAMGMKNQNLTDQLARKALGLGPDEPITAEAMREIRKAAYQRGYEPIAQAGRMDTDAAYQGALDSIMGRYQGAAADFPGVASDTVSKFVNGAGRGGVPARSAWVDQNGNLLHDFVEPQAPQLRSLLEELKRSGGLHPSEVDDLGMGMLNKSNPGLLRKEGGQTADDLLEWMQQNGWINAQHVRDAEGLPGGAQEYAKDLLRTALSGEKVVHPAQADVYYAYYDAMEQIHKAGINKITIPEKAAEFSGGLRNIKNFDAGNAVKMTQILRDEAGDAFRQGDAALGKAKREAAKAIEDQIERGLLKKGADGAEALKAFREARQLMAKSHEVEKAIVAEGGHVNAKVLARALQKNPGRLSGELKTIGAFANNFGDVAGVPKSGHANPFTVMDFWTGTLGHPAIPAARLAARAAVMGPMQGGAPNYAPGLLTRMSPAMLEEMKKRGMGGLLGAYAGQ